MKLKTLNDLIHKRTILGRGQPIELLDVNIDELKAEAIKRAKWWKNQMEIDFKVPRDYDYWKGRFDEIVEANNITSEDLQ